MIARLLCLFFPITTTDAWLPVGIPGLIPGWYEIVDTFVDQSPDEPVFKLPEGDYYITYAGGDKSKYHGFSLSFEKDDDLSLRTDLQPIWRLYYPQYSGKQFVLQNMWLGQFGEGHPWFSWFAQLDDRHIELEPMDPTLWVAFNSTEPDTFYIRAKEDKDKWLGLRERNGKLILRHFKHEREMFKFVRLE